MKCPDRANGYFYKSPPNAPESLACFFIFSLPASGTLAVAHLAHHTRSAARLDLSALASRSPERDPRGGDPRCASAVPQDVAERILEGTKFRFT